MSQKQIMGPFRPVLNKPEDREKSILEDTPALFEIKQTKRTKPSGIFGAVQNAFDETVDEVRTFDSYGKKAVQDNDEKILRQAQKHNLDPDLIRSVMYAENARGHKIVLNKWSDDLKFSESPLPMNIQKNRWSKLIGKKPEDMYDSENNIEAATILLKRISNRIKKPTPEKIGSIWNYMGREKANEFGEYIGEVYREKPWKKLD